MSKILNILGIVVRVLAIIVLLFSSVFSMATAYIMFMPDTFPKPFYLQYAYPTEAVPVVEAPEQEAAPEANTGELQPGQGVMIDTGTKIINLVDPTRKQYLKVTVVIEFAPDNPDYESLPEEEKSAYLANFNTELSAKLPVIDDVIITLVSTKTFDDLYTAAGKESLRLEIKDQISQRVPEYQILSVYFTEFIVN
ncbi:MAG TPA: flagellar basal body-associated FliL family protein [Anaerolineaceae bacterium]|nr:flagellar basal body-associated FliL family protein [Anaerolineaceae bacterium]